MTEEDRQSYGIVEGLKQKLAASKLRTIEIGTRKKVLIGLTCGHSENGIRFMLQSAQQDIVVYLKDETLQIKTTNDSPFQKCQKSLTDGRLLIPIMIIEVKFKGVVTHAIRQYSEIARMIKTIFPFCKYDLLLLDMSLSTGADKTYMAGKDFDKIIYRKDHTADPQETICEVYQEIREHVGYLKRNPFYRLGQYL